MKRSRISSVSDRRREQFDARLDVTLAVAARDRCCQAFALGAVRLCSGPDDVHEIVSRAVWRDSWLDPDYCILLCRRHHEWVTDYTVLGQFCGLVVPRHAFDLHGDGALREAARIRRVGHDRPMWATDDEAALAVEQARRCGVWWISTGG